MIDCWLLAGTWGVKVHSRLFCCPAVRLLLAFQRLLRCTPTAATPFGNAAGRGGRGGRGGGRGGGNGGGGRIEAYVSPSMLENPWAALERRLLGGGSAGGPQQQQQQQHAGAPYGSAGEGRLSVEGAADRPWH